LTQYIDHINVVTTSMAAVYASGEYAPLMPLFEHVLSAPASSAPVERVFSQSGLIMRPNRARMSDKMLEELVSLKCNDW